MQQVQIPDRVYNQVQQRAIAAGFKSVDDYVADVLLHDADAPDNFDHLFTPALITELDRISSEIAAGAKTYTLDELDAFLNETRESWRANHAA